MEGPKSAKKTMTQTDPLSRRERQIMDIVYARGQATAAEVTAALPDPPSYSAVRALLRILEQKGHLRHQQDGPRYVFLPTVSRDRARRSALRNIVKTFFDGSTAQAAAALIDQGQLSDAEFDRLSEAIEKARRENR
jgi:BlaI family transcriptional regulator, penicillinase repressor